jgi:hypothetical protein
VSAETSRPEARAALAAQQARLVGSLTAAAPPPEGFDAARVLLAAATLRNKRRRGVARAWPGLPSSLGEHFHDLFDAYASASPHPAAGGPAADARAFAEHLARSGRLPEPARLELALARCRRGFPLRAVLLRDPRRLLLAARLPGWGVRYLRVPLGRR